MPVLKIKNTNGDLLSSFTFSTTTNGTYKHKMTITKDDVKYHAPLLANDAKGIRYGQPSPTLHVNLDGKEHVLLDGWHTFTITRTLNTNAKITWSHLITNPWGYTWNGELSPFVFRITPNVSGTLNAYGANRVTAPSNTAGRYPDTFYTNTNVYPIQRAYYYRYSVQNIIGNLGASIVINGNTWTCNPGDQVIGHTAEG